MQVVRVAIDVAGDAQILEFTMHVEIRARERDACEPKQAKRTISRQIRKRSGSVTVDFFDGNIQARLRGGIGQRDLCKISAIVAVVGECDLSLRAAQLELHQITISIMDDNNGWRAGTTERDR